MVVRNIGIVIASALMYAGVAPSVYGAAGADDGSVEARTEAAKAASGDFLKQLGGAMKKEMQAGGPVGAMKVCRDIAPEVANDISLEKGWRVVRVGTRARNTMLGMPDVWEQKVLQDFQNRAAAGEKFDTMTYSEVVEEPAGKSFRFMKAIGVAPQCLMCHGTEEQIAEPVRERLKALYPHDRAVNYKAGDLRGAVSIKQPM